MLTEIAMGIPKKNKTVLKKFDLNVKYPKTALRIKREMMDLSPLQASTT